jgi:hypothetical protein
MFIGFANHDGTEAAEFFVQQTGGPIGGLGTEGVAANEFGEVFGMVGGAGLERAHFVEDDGDACLSDLPSGFGASEAAADDMDRCVVRHGQKSNPEKLAFSRIEPQEENGIPEASKHCSIALRLINNSYIRSC